MIRSVSHSLKFTNQGKLDQLYEFISRYTQMATKYINVLWHQDPFREQALVPNSLCQSISTEANTDSRIRQCAAKQASSIIRGTTTKRRQQLYKLAKLQKEGKNTKYLQRKIAKIPIKRPQIKSLNVELDSRFVDFKEGDKEFDLFVRLSQIGNKEEIILPIKFNKCTRKWMKEGTLKASIRISHKSLTLYFEVNEPKRQDGKVIGADQGLVTCLSLSDGQVTKKNRHGYDLHSITKVISRRKKGSKGFRRSQSHRENYINWSLNQLNFSHVKEVKFEKIKDIRRGKKSSSSMNHWTYTLIKDKLVRLGEEKGFLFTEQDNKFRSQRCSLCGWVHKSNRKGKTFKCTNINCDFKTDSDLNAASNHEAELYEIFGSHKVCQLHLNRSSGFFWNKDGIVIGEECIVPHTQKEQFL